MWNCVQSESLALRKNLSSAMSPAKECHVGRQSYKGPLTNDEEHAVK
jgi:hypothetical protein